MNDSIYATQMRAYVVSSMKKKLVTERNSENFWDFFRPIESEKNWLHDGRYGQFRKF